ncbi:hypothetical protein K491DRAFT_256401 [Lophiostoma macrostomum CBS 122681]|uniref:Uncharacterized protein n=1 Tax=Lophiostoma macrostomum CBS 122681 TaxID=1314788 RepID=A0A6A6SKA2_9PLEO|nr:hypothetical protein K491DRAFT_256401 [Lophiostoma macrostomum CBS 122681]
MFSGSKDALRHSLNREWDIKRRSNIERFAPMDAREAVLERYLAHVPYISRQQCLGLYACEAVPAFQMAPPQMVKSQSLGRANGAWGRTSAVAQPAGQDTIAYGFGPFVPEGCHELSEHLSGPDLERYSSEVMLSHPSIAVRRHLAMTALQMTSSDMSIPRAVPRMRDASLCTTRVTTAQRPNHLECLDTCPENGHPPPACPPLQGWRYPRDVSGLPAVRTAALSRSCAGRPIQPGPCFETPSRQAIGACSSCRRP